MIVVKLIGGIGNQMFQYSLGRHLAIENKTILLLDLTELLDRTSPKSFTFRNYELDEFNIHAQIAKPDDLAIFFPGNSLLKNIVNGVKKAAGVITIKHEKGFIFQPSVFSHKPNIYLDGFWQSEKYFLKIEDIIRNDFTLKPESIKFIDDSIILSDIKYNINHSNSISIHFRRGDYISNPETNNYHGVCPEEYYLKAISVINSKIENPNYFIFSDEPAWITENFSFPGSYKIIQDNPGYLDLYLMSLCKHNIIANSSFSWWGGWLNSNPSKIVIAPKKWFNEYNADTRDLCPTNWIRI